MKTFQVHVNNWKIFNTFEKPIFLLTNWCFHGEKCLNIAAEAIEKEGTENEYVCK